MGRQSERLLGLLGEEEGVEGARHGLGDDDAAVAADAGADEADDVGVAGLGEGTDLGVEAVALEGLVALLVEADHDIQAAVHSLVAALQGIGLTKSIRAALNMKFVYVD